MDKSKLSPKTKEKIMDSLKEHVDENYIGRYGLIDIEMEWDESYLYIDWIKGLTKEGMKRGAWIYRVILEYQGFEEEEIEENVEEFYQMLQYELSGDRHKLCRLKFLESGEWELEIYHYREDCYISSDELTCRQGSVDECFDAAADVYIKKGLFERPAIPS